MKTVVSKTGVEVLYPCSIHLLDNGQIFECEYKSDHTGRDLIDYICEHINLQDKDLWGLKFVDIFEQRHWLEQDTLIRTQVKNVCPTHFHFRVKVYPPEPYKLLDEQTKFQIFMQLRLDLLSGRLGCGPSDSALLLALILQYTHGDYDEAIHSGNYIKMKVLLNQSFATEMKAMDLHRNHLNGLSPAQTQDLFLRMACQLQTYGIDPYLVEDLGHESYNLWINHKGMVTYVDGRKVHSLEWMAVNRIYQEENKLKINLVSGDTVTFVCLTKAECTYIFQGAVAHLVYFTSTGTQSTIGLIGNESLEELEADIKSFEVVERIEYEEMREVDEKIRLQRDMKKTVCSKIYCVGGITLQEALEIAFYDENVTDIYIEPPESNVLRDESSSADEDEGRLADNLNARKFSAPAENIFMNGERLNGIR
ncbi:unnamed protein product [Phaedon cochleariae]|uniref:FERM domain-containing protein n=1 Tax=Phaedon cochleariae TaxID=80249 RepID=A0A9N9X5Q1_PHACE|nr:unnamed protein product [Phaedon cochleariae]